MLCGFVRADENCGNVPSIALLQNRVLINVDFAQDRAKFAKQRRDGGFGFLTKVAARTRVKRDVARAAGRKLRVFARIARAHGFPLKLPSSVSTSCGVFPKRETAG